MALADGGPDRTMKRETLLSSFKIDPLTALFARVFKGIRCLRIDHPLVSLGLRLLPS
jgi:hypothetical protein